MKLETSFAPSNGSFLFVFLHKLLLNEIKKNTSLQGDFSDPISNPKHLFKAYVCGVLSLLYIPITDAGDNMGIS